MEEMNLLLKKLIQEKPRTMPGKEMFKRVGKFKDANFAALINNHEFNSLTQLCFLVDEEVDELVNISKKARKEVMNKGIRKVITNEDDIAKNNYGLDVWRLEIARSIISKVSFIMIIIKIILLRVVLPCTKSFVVPSLLILKETYG